MCIVSTTKHLPCCHHASRIYICKKNPEYIDAQLLHEACNNVSLRHYDVRSILAPNTNDKNVQPNALVTGEHYATSRATGHSGTMKEYYWMQYYFGCTEKGVTEWYEAERAMKCSEWEIPPMKIETEEECAYCLGAWWITPSVDGSRLGERVRLIGSTNVVESVDGTVGLVVVESQVVKPSFI